MSDESRSITQKHRQIQSQNLPSNSSYGATPKWSSQKNQSIFNFEGQKRKEHHKNGKKIKYIMTITCFHHIWFDWLYFFFSKITFLFHTFEHHIARTNFDCHPSEIWIKTNRFFVKTEKRKDRRCKSSAYYCLFKII